MSNTPKRYRLEKKIDCPDLKAEAGTIGILDEASGKVWFGEERNFFYSLSTVLSATDWFSPITDNLYCSSCVTKSACLLRGRCAKNHPVAPQVQENEKSNPEKKETERNIFNRADLDQARQDGWDAAREVKGTQTANVHFLGSGEVEAWFPPKYRSLEEWLKIRENAGIKTSGPKTSPD